MAEGGLVHYSVLLFVFQALAAVVVLGSTIVSLRARVAAALLIFLNGIVSLVAPYDGHPTWGRLGLAADAPTAVVITYLALALMPDAPGRTRAWLMRGLVVLGILGAIGAFVLPFRPSPVWYEAIYVGYGSRLSYSLILIVLLREALARPSWHVQWLLGAFLLRAADLAVHYPPTDLTLLAAPPPLILSVVLVGVFVLALVSPRADADLKRIVVTLALAGALFGLLSGFTTSSFAAFQESLVTLAVGRPALMVVALRAPGFVRPFFRAVFTGLAAYLATVVALEALGAFDNPYWEALLALASAATTVAAWWMLGRTTHAPPRHVEVGAPTPASAPARPPPPRSLEDWQRLLVVLSQRQDGSAMNRRAIADALGILPRNVQRVVDAANRAPGVAPGTQLVMSSFERGPSNQLQYHYAATPEGRALAASIDDPHALVVDGSQESR